MEQRTRLLPDASVFLSLGALIVALLIPIAALAQLSGPLVLKEQGSFFVGGDTKSVSVPAGGRLPAQSGDITVNQMYVQYQVPMTGARHAPVVFELGIRGNSHMLMQDKNSNQVADLLLAWIDQHVETRRNSRR